MYNVEYKSVLSNESVADDKREKRLTQFLSVNIGESTKNQDFEPLLARFFTF